MKQSILIQAAVEWWNKKRPLEYSIEDHLRNPIINTATVEEEALAEATAEVVKEQRLAYGRF